MMQFMRQAYYDWKLKKVVYPKPTPGLLKTGSAVVKWDTNAPSNSLVYSKEGWKCKRIGYIDWVSITPGGGDGSGTMYVAITDSGIPHRGDPHPYITNAMLGITFVPGFAADVITVTPYSSTQLKVDVEYAVLNALTQEPGVSGDTNPALLTVASSAQAEETVTDYLGRPMICSYAGGEDIFDDTGKKVYDSSSPGTPITSQSKAAVQRTRPIFRFQRRETAQRSPNGLVGYVNLNDWVILGFTNVQDTLLCTRVENETQDEGFSYIVTYEFQFKATTPAVTGPPAQLAIPGWCVGSYYTIQNGYAANPLTGNKLAQAGQIPLDASANVFQVQGRVDFNSILSLTP